MRKYAFGLALILLVMFTVTACEDKKFGVYKSIVITEESYTELARGTITLYKDGKITESDYLRMKDLGKKVELAINSAKMALRLYVSFEDQAHYAELIAAVDEMMRLFEQFRVEFQKAGGGK